MDQAATRLAGVILGLSLLGLSACARNTDETPEAMKAAIALTYDDAMPSQLANAVPALDAHGFKATFYISLAFDGFSTQRAAWSAVADAGHELGNHTLFHPCQASKPGRDWVVPQRDLDLYTKSQLLDEVSAANDMLDALDGGQARTFAYTCGDTEVGGESFIDDLKPLFVGARSVQRNLPYNRFMVPSLAVDNTSAAEMIAYVDSLIERGAVGTITFHGIGDGHLPVTTEAHEELLAYLERKEKAGEIRVAPLRDILALRERSNRR